MRETVEEKADRLVATGRVRLILDSPGRVLARVEGDTDVYAVQGPPDDLVCECQAAKCHVACSHRLAVESLMNHQS